MKEELGKARNHISYRSQKIKTFFRYRIIYALTFQNKFVAEAPRMPLTEAEYYQTEMSALLSQNPKQLKEENLKLIYKHHLCTYSHE